jgi:hypothetical protein
LPILGEIVASESGRRLLEQEHRTFLKAQRNSISRTDPDLKHTGMPGEVAINRVKQGVLHVRVWLVAIYDRQPQSNESG